MIRLNMARGAEWLDLGHGVRVQVAPLTTSLLAAARDLPRFRTLPEDAGPELRQAVFCGCVAVVAVLDWDGVAGPDGADKAPLTPESVQALMDIYPISLVFHREYLARGLLLVTEKNGYAPLPTGTSAGATGTAGPAPDGPTDGATAAPMTRMPH